MQIMEKEEGKKNVLFSVVGCGSIHVFILQLASQIGAGSLTV
jgi:hypothetical protein